jgi:hypothetical protein
MSEAAKLYTRLIKEFGMPECKRLMSLGNQWYEAPEGVNDDPNEAISTAVFRLLPEAESASIMAKHAAKWCTGALKKEAAATDPIERLRQIVAHAAARKK